MAEDSGTPDFPAGRPVEAASTVGDVIPSEDFAGAQWFGHPRGLSTLFFTEMWERFSYYGMRALLVLFMTAPLAAANPGLGYGEARAGAIYGLYTSLVYLLALPGGWVADKLWGQKKAVFIGGCIIAAGHFSMAVPTIGTFFFGLLLIVIGTGLLKPNVSTVVGDLYPASEGGARRDAGFSIFYMGINIGALAGTFLCGLIGEQYNFHWGFSLAGIGMVLGLIQYKLGAKYLAGAGDLKTGEGAEVLSRRSRNFYMVAAGVAAATVLLVFLVTSGALEVELVATWLGWGIILLTILFFTWLIFGGAWTAGVAVLYVALAALLLPMQGQEVGMRNTSLIVLGLFLVVSFAYALSKKASITNQRLVVIFWLFLLAALFWSGFEQAGSSLNIFARDYTNRTYGGWEMPASWLQNVNPFFIIVFAPIFGWLWTWLARRNANPSIPFKFALGLLGLSAGFFVLAWGAANSGPDARVSAAWLVVTYFLHTVGELFLSPVGLSSVTKLAPPDRVGQMMGIWFIGASVGNLFAGLVAGRLENLPPNELFWNVALYIGGAGLVALLVAPFIKRLTAGIE